MCTTGHFAVLLAFLTLIYAVVKNGDFQINYLTILPIVYSLVIAVGMIWGVFVNLKRPNKISQELKGQPMIVLSALGGLVVLELILLLQVMDYEFVTINVNIPLLNIKTAP